MFTLEEENYLKRFVAFKLAETLIYTKTLALDAMRAALYKKGDSKAVVDAQAQPFELEIKNLELDKISQFKPEVKAE